MSQGWIGKQEAFELAGLKYGALYQRVKAGDVRTRRIAVPGKRGTELQYMRDDIKKIAGERAVQVECASRKCSTSISPLENRMFCSVRCREHERHIRHQAKRNAKTRELYNADPQKYIAITTAIHKRNPEKYGKHFRASQMRTRYGITVEQFAALEAASGGVCWICEKPQRETRHDGKLRNLVVDHDHALPQADPAGVRGLLCTACNVRLKALEDTEWYASAVTYLAERATYLVPVFDGVQRFAGRGRKYGLSDEQVAWMEEQCGGRCELCPCVPSGGKYDKLNIDHDHEKEPGDPGFVRGLVCSHCNTKLGVLDDHSFVEAATEYLASAPARAQAVLATVHPAT